MANELKSLSCGMISMAFLIGVISERAAALTNDKTNDALNHCQNEPADVSTGGQTQCETAAKASYDRRMNAAYAALQRTLPVNAREQLRQSQRAWLAFRNLETSARRTIFAARNGTMYVPMEASAETNITRDRALQLESYQRVMSIEP